MQSVVASVFDLGGIGRYVHWHWIQISVANLVVIGVMLVLFILAIVLPFPHGRGSATTADGADRTAPLDDEEVSVR